MALNKQSNVYTIIYIVVLVVVVGAALAFTSLSLKDRQVENANADKMRQILASVHITPDKGNVVDDYNKYITESFIVNAEGRRVDGDAFDVNVEAQSKTSDEALRELPVYVCTLADGTAKYILPVYGAGLWGPSGDMYPSTPTARLSMEHTSPTRARRPDLAPKLKSLRSPTNLPDCTCSRTDNSCPWPL